jgi:hypothetical protein
MHTSSDPPSIVEGGLSSALSSAGGSALGEDDDELMTPEQEAKHKEFAKQRGRHYSNEGEAMKRAQALIAQEEDENDEDDEDEDENGRQQEGGAGGGALGMEMDADAVDGDKEVVLGERGVDEAAVAAEHMMDEDLDVERRTYGH